MSARFFKLQGDDLGIEGGRYKDTAKFAPMQAARNAARRIFKIVENVDNKPEWKKFKHLANGKTLKIILRETTQGSEKSTYYFNISRQALNKPIVKNINGVTVTVTHKVVAEKCSGSA